MSRAGKLMRRAFAGVLTVLVSGSPSAAQPRIFALVRDGPFPALTTSLWEARLDDAAPGDARRLAVVDGWVSGFDVDGVQPMVAGGGQFVLWRRSGAPGSLIAFDRAGGTTHVLPDPGPLRVSDPTRARVFASVPAGIASLTPTGLDVLPGTAGLTPVAISADGARLLSLAVTSPGPPTHYELRTSDSVSGAPLGAVPLGYGVVHAVPSPDETSVWVVSQSFNGVDWPTRLREVLLPSGDVRLELELPPSTLFESVRARIEAVERRNGRVVVSVTTRAPLLRDALLSAELRTIDSATGNEVGRVPLEGEAASHLDEASGTIVTYSPDWLALPFLPCAAGFLHRVSIISGQELSRTAVGACVKAAFAASPAPPSLNTPAISPTRTVRLTWDRSPALIAGFVVEAGSAPGLSNLGTFPVTNGTTLTVPNVPPGTYYVRVRAWNYIGASAPSNEIIVAVP
jgi:hypothetical protein